MLIAESTNLNSMISITEADGTVKNVVSINSNVVKDGASLSVNFSILDNVTLQTNVTSVQADIDTFMNSLKEKMISLNYVITI